MIAAGTAPDYLASIDLSVMATEVAEVRHAQVVGKRGERIRLYEFGRPTAEKVVLLPPYGITFLLVARVARLLAERFHVLVWESRGCPDVECPAADRDFELAEQAADFAHVIRQAGFSSFHFMGWCQAPQIAALAMVDHGVQPKTMTWVAPGGFAQARVTSEFDRCALPIYLEIERNGLEHAALLSQILDKHRGAAMSAAIAAEKLTMLHLSDAQATHTFARYMRAYEENKPRAKALLAPSLNSVPTLLIHCKDDRYSHFSESVQIAKQHPAVSLRLFEQGGHLQVFDAPSIVAAEFFRFVEPRRVDVMSPPTRLERGEAP